MDLSSTLVGLLVLALLLAGFSLLRGRGMRHSSLHDDLLRVQAEAGRADTEKYRTEVEAARVAGARQQAECIAAEQRAVASETRCAELNALIQQLHHQLGLARQDLSSARTQLERDHHAAEEKLGLLTGARAELSHQFESLANKILEEKSQRFTEQNTASMGHLLTPLRDKLGEFQQRVESLQQEGLTGRTELRAHIETLGKLNDRLSSEASSLASALKGSSKTQGDWGEVLLERMLEDSGLRKGVEYRVQESFTREDRTRARPDVILNLPGSKHLVIDAKVSLVDYSAYCECDNEVHRAVALTRHVNSLREHIRGLAKRNYQTLYQLESIDFVVLFVPIEPAYLLALSKDGRLWQEAWEANVLLVSPGTLFPVIRTVAHLWNQERQHTNVKEIVRRGGDLYDKLSAFAGDLVKVGIGLDTARDSYDKAMGKLKTGKFSAIRQAELLRDFGVIPTKPLPRELLEFPDETIHFSAEGRTTADPSLRSG